MEEYRRWEDNIKMDLKEIGVNVMSVRWCVLQLEELIVRFIREGMMAIHFKLNWIKKQSLEGGHSLSNGCCAME